VGTLSKRELDALVEEAIVWIAAYRHWLTGV
jgi:hypothetical protein